MPSMTSNAREVGFWYSQHEPHLPKPQEFVDPDWDPALRLQVLEYVKNGRERAAYRGFSRCRFCGKSNGSLELTDGTYIWPEGFAHYIEDHLVKPPEDFIRHVLDARHDETVAELCSLLKIQRSLDTESARAGVLFLLAHIPALQAGTSPQILPPASIVEPVRDLAEFALKGGFLQAERWIRTRLEMMESSIKRSW